MDLLTVEHLTKTYGTGENAVHALDDVSFSVPRGSFLPSSARPVPANRRCCVPSQALNRFRRHYFAQRRSDRNGQAGTESAGRSKRSSELRTRVGMVFQSYDLFPNKTVLGNITLAPTLVQKRDKAEVEQEAIKLLERVGLPTARIPGRTSCPAANVNAWPSAVR